MKKIIPLLIWGAIVSQTQPSFASGISLSSISHIHQVKISGRVILLGTHEGLYILKSGNSVEKIGRETFDVMGLSVDGDRYFASGHPGPDSRLLDPVGLLRSTDKGKSWKKISLEGKVDFHLLESRGSELYGADSQSGALMYSDSDGATWAVRGINAFSDIAIHPTKKSRALGLDRGELITTRDSFLTKRVLPSASSFSQIEWVQKNLVATSGRNLMYSPDQGQTWKKIYSFPTTISGLAQSRKMLVVITGNQVWQSTNQGKTFALFE